MNPEKSSMKKQAEQWLHFAYVDLRSAKKLREDKDLTQVAAFHIHQCVEKSIKAILEYKDQKTPKIHNLVLLTEFVRKLGIDPSEGEDILDEINQVYIESRYPADLGLLPGGIPSAETIEKFIEFAINLYNFAEKMINEGSS